MIFKNLYLHKLLEVQSFKLMRLIGHSSKKFSFILKSIEKLNMFTQIERLMRD